MLSEYFGASCTSEKRPADRNGLPERWTSLNLLTPTHKHTRGNQQHTHTIPSIVYFPTSYRLWFIFVVYLLYPLVLHYYFSDNRIYIKISCLIKQSQWELFLIEWIIRINLYSVTLYSSQIHLGFLRSILHLNSLLLVRRITVLSNQVIIVDNLGCLLSLFYDNKNYIDNSARLIKWPSGKWLAPSSYSHWINSFCLNNIIRPFVFCETNICSFIYN